MLDRRLIRDEPARSPYAARVTFLIGDNVDLKIDGPVTLVTSYPRPIELRVAKRQPFGRFAPFKRFVAEAIGFNSAGTAEAEGLRLALAFLWAAASRHFPLYLDYSTVLPVTVYDRTSESGGLSVRAHGRVTLNMGLASLIDQMDQVLERQDPIDRALLLSLELFAGARLELTERARFITLVSALEPLAEQQTLPDGVATLVGGFLSELGRTKLPTDDLNGPNRLRQSLMGRIRSLKRESVRQAILRTVQELLPDDPETVAAVDEAYALRSQMLHEGGNDPYLSKRSQKLTSILRRLYSVRLDLPLAAPA